MSKSSIWYERNQEAERLEREGRLDEALKLYQQNAREGCNLSFTYVRMAAIYRNRHDHPSEADALHQALTIEQQRGPSRRLVDLKTKLERAQRLSERAPQPARGPRERSEAAPRPVRSQPASEKGCLARMLAVVAGLLLTGVLSMI